MQITFHPVLPVLKPFVKVVCSIRFNCVSNEPSLRVLADNCVELFVNYGNTPRNFVMSRMTGFMDTQMEETTGSIAICFFPGKAYPFFPIPMQELTDQVSDLADVWKKSFPDLEKVLETVNDPEQCAYHLQLYLIRLWMKNHNADKTIDYCVHAIHESKGQLSIHELAAKTGISNRQMARRFNQRIGVSPKEFACTTRLLNALRVLKQRPALSLTEIAYESGYYDQAHFIHEIKEYSGVTPTNLLASRHILY